MLKVWNCVAYEHDLRLLGLAVVVCALATFTTISLLHHVCRSKGRTRLIWLAVSATATGFGIWATHFIAMLAFTPGIPNAYNIPLTALSLVAAIVLTGVGLTVATTRDLPAGAWLGGAIVGGGIAAMHYTGMAAFEIQGRLLWDPALVTASIALGALFGAIALPVGLREGGRAVEDTRCPAADARNLQSPLHRDGRGVAHSGSNSRTFERGTAVRLVRDCSGAGHIHYRGPRPCRGGDRGA
jgi:diguanylate cyclase